MTKLSHFFVKFILYSCQDLDEPDVSNSLHTVHFKNHNFTFYVYFVDKIMSMHILSNPDFLRKWEKTYAAILTMFSKIKASVNLLAYITVFI